MKFMTILLLVFLSTIQANTDIYILLRKCLRKSIEGIDRITSYELFGLTSNDVIQGKADNHYFTAKTYTHKHHKYIRDNIEHDLFVALRPNAGSKVNDDFLRQPQFFHINCHESTDFDVNITKYIPEYDRVEDTYNEIHEKRGHSFWDTFWNDDLAATCQLYDLTKRLNDIHNAGFHHNNVSIYNIGYDENGKLTFNDYGKASKRFIFNEDMLSTYPPSEKQQYEQTGKESDFGFEVEAYQLARIAYYLKFGVEYSQEKYFPPYGESIPRSIDCFFYIFNTNIENFNLKKALNCLKGIIEENNNDACNPTHAKIVKIQLEVKQDVASNELVAIPKKKEHPPQKEDLSPSSSLELTKDNYLNHKKGNTRMDNDEDDGGMTDISKLINRYRSK